MSHFKILLDGLKQCQIRNYTSDSSKILDLNYLRETLSKFSKKNYYHIIEPKNKNIQKLSRASVLVPISIQKATDNEGKVNYQTFYTFSKRTMEMKTFKGQVCFVGGRRDATDKSDIETAYREAEEEVGIKPESLTFLAEMCPVITTTGVLITPIVAYLDKTNFQPKLNKHEVEVIFDLPTERFLSVKNHKFTSIRGGKVEHYMHSFANDVEGRNMDVTGVTAFMCVYISSVIHKRLPEFKFDPEIPLDFEQDKFLQEYLLVKSSGLLSFLSNKKNKINL
jgi:8-oxo-dGTP pyrophosphatase MutT (NUDIX family)